MSVKLNEVEPINKSSEDLIAEVNARLKAELENDQKMCLEEMETILKKYNLVQTPIIQQTWGPTGLLDMQAGVTLSRPQRKEGQNG